MYPTVKQVKPKLTTAIKSTILIDLAILFHGFLFRSLCNQRGLSSSGTREIPRKDAHSAQEEMVAEATAPRHILFYIDMA